MDVIGPNRYVEYRDLPYLEYTERFIKESNRLFPIAVAIVRELQQDIRLEDNVELPAGSSAVLSILSTHRSKDYWTNPLKFDPDRFLPDEISKRHPYCYLAFSGGPRSCIGILKKINFLKYCLISE